jgi:hypothetical protein
VNFVHAVPVVITRELPITVVHGNVRKAPGGQPGVDRVFIGVDDTSSLNSRQDVGLDRALLDVGAQVKHEHSTSLNHAQDWGLVGRGTAASSLAF